MHTCETGTRATLTRADVVCLDLEQSRARPRRWTGIDDIIAFFIIASVLVIFRFCPDLSCFQVNLLHLEFPVTTFFFLPQKGIDHGRSRPEHPSEKSVPAAVSQ